MIKKKKKKKENYQQNIICENQFIGNGNHTSLDDFDKFQVTFVNF